MKRHRSLKGLYTTVALNQLFFNPVATDVPGIFPGANDAQLALGTKYCSVAQLG